MIDQSLRDALISHWDENCNGVDWLAGTPEEYASEAIRFLAAHPAEPAVDDLAARLRASVDAAKARRLAHPAEPAPVVTDEAVRDWSDEAFAVLAEATGLSTFVDGLERNAGMCDDSGLLYLRGVASRLGGLAPLLGPRPLLDREQLRTELIQFGIDVKMDDPTVGSSEMVDRRVDAVMELARPMPTADEFAGVLLDYTDSLAIANDAADAVVAWLNEAES